MRLLRGQLAADVRGIRTDSLLLAVIAMPFIIVLFYRFVLIGPDELVQVVATGLPAALEPHRALVERFAAEFGPVMMSLFIGMTPATVGSVYGLLLVDERDERTLAAVRVMPVPFLRYIAMRLAAPFSLSVVTTIAAYPLAGLAPLPLTTVAVIALSAGLAAPTVALIIVTYAPNKLAALVLMRVSAAALSLPVVALVAISGWDRLAWPVPSYWPMRALQLAADGRNPALALVLGPALNVPLLAWLCRELVQRPER
jgi:fluoroquinolone transport system permease protein